MYYSVCVCECAAVSTARIGMSGMIGIEFFKNAFSPGRGGGGSRVCVYTSRPGSRSDRNAVCRQTRDVTDRDEVTTAATADQPAAYCTRSSVVVIAYAKNKKKNRRGKTRRAQKMRAGCRGEDGNCGFLI